MTLPVAALAASPLSFFARRSTLVKSIPRVLRLRSTISSRRSASGGNIFQHRKSLGQHFLKHSATAERIVDAFAEDSAAAEATWGAGPGAPLRPVEIGPGGGALTFPLHRSREDLTCIEADRRCVEALSKSHPSLDVRLADVLRFDFPSLSAEKKGGLHVVGNLPYNISSSVLFLLADAAAGGYVRSATVLLQREMARRVAPQVASERGMLSTCLGIYADVQWHFDVGPEQFDPPPAVQSALVGIRFVSPEELRRRLGGVSPAHYRMVARTSFGKRRKMLRRSLRDLMAGQPGGDASKAEPELARDWMEKRPEELSAAEFVELTGQLCGRDESSWNPTEPVWRKKKHGWNVENR